MDSAIKIHITIANADRHFWRSAEDTFQATCNKIDTLSNRVVYYNVKR